MTIKKIVENNFVVFMYEVQQLVADGYRLSTDFVPGYYGYHYEAELSKEEKALDKVVLNQEQQGKLDEVNVAGLIIPIVEGEATKENVEKVVEAATSPKRGRKPTGK